MENLQRFENNIQKLNSDIEEAKNDYEELKVAIDEDNIRLESLIKVANPSIENPITLDTIEQSNKQIRKEIEANKNKVEKQNRKVEKLEDTINNTRNDFKNAIYKNRQEAKDNKSKAFAKYSMMNKKFHSNIDQGRKLKLKMKAFSDDKDNKEVYKTLTAEHAKHMQLMKQIAKERNEVWKQYNEASKEYEKVMMDTESLLFKYNLEKTETKDKDTEKIEHTIKKETPENDQVETENEKTEDENLRFYNEDDLEKRIEENYRKLINEETPKEEESIGQTTEDKMEAPFMEEPNEGLFKKLNEFNGPIILKSREPLDIEEELDNLDNENPVQLDKKTIEKIYIFEKDKTIKIYDNLERKGKLTSFVDNLLKLSSEKLDLYQTTGIKDICKELTESRREARKLKKKLNPNIIKACELVNSDLIEEYIKSIKEEKELPFEVVHDLDGLNPISKFFKQRSKAIKAEEKCGAKILNKLFDQNNTLESGEEEKNDQREDDNENKHEQHKQEEQQEDVKTKHNKFKENLDPKNYSQNDNDREEDDDLLALSKAVGIFKEEESQDEHEVR